MDNVVERLSPFAKMFMVDVNPELGMWLLFITIFLLSVLVYKLGFALKLPILKSVIIYIFLFFGSTILTFLAIQLPVAEGLVVAALILIIYKIRLRAAKKAEEV